MNLRRKSQPQSARSILDALFRKTGLNTTLSRHAVVANWPRIVGSAVAAHARADKVSGATLYVEVDSSVWMNELAALKPVLLDKINAGLPRGVPPIDEIRFRQRSRASAKPVPAQELPAPEPDENHNRMVGQILEPIADNDLRQLLARILDKDRIAKWRRDAE